MNLILLLACSYLGLSEANIVSILKKKFCKVLSWKERKGCIYLIILPFPVRLTRKNLQQLPILAIIFGKNYNPVFPQNS